MHTLAQGRQLLVAALLVVLARAAQAGVVPAADFDPLLDDMAHYLIGGLHATSSFLVADLGSTTGLLDDGLADTTDFVVTSMGSTVNPLGATREGVGQVLSDELKLEALLAGTMDGAVFLLDDLAGTTAFLTGSVDAPAAFLGSGLEGTRTFLRGDVTGAVDLVVTLVGDVSLLVDGLLGPEGPPGPLPFTALLGGSLRSGDPLSGLVGSLRH